MSYKWNKMGKITVKANKYILQNIEKDLEKKYYHIAHGAITDIRTNRHHLLAPWPENLCKLSKKLTLLWDWKWLATWPEKLAMGKLWDWNYLIPFLWHQRKMSCQKKNVFAMRTYCPQSAKGHPKFQDHRPRFVKGRCIQHATWSSWCTKGRETPREEEMTLIHNGKSRRQCFHPQCDKGVSTHLKYSYRTVGGSNVCVFIMSRLLMHATICKGRMRIIYDNSWA